MMETAWAKLADYYELTEDSPVYSAATALNPSLKWTYMEKIWDDKKTWIARAKLRVAQLRKETYQPAPRKRFPHLSLMAIDISSIAPMSTETERLFSKAKRTMTDQRGSMNSETLNLIECLRSWDNSALMIPSAHSYVKPTAEALVSEA